MAILNGITGYGVLSVPEIIVGYKKPALKNNGFNSFSGQGKERIPGLKILLDKSNSGLVLVSYKCGAKSLFFAQCNTGDDVYSFS